MKYSVCMRCDDVVETWTLTEVFDEINKTHLHVCNECLRTKGFRREDI